MSHGVLYTCPNSTIQLLVCMGLGVLYTYQRGASALLVSTNRAIPTASNREASDNAEFHAFFVKNVLRK